MFSTDRNGFWRDTFRLQGSITPLVMPLILLFGLIAGVVCLLSWAVERSFQVQIGVEVAPYEIAGALLTILLLVRTNAGMDRWWEARKLWGGIVNQSRNIAINALAYGPNDPEWRDQMVRWTASFPYIACNSLRGEPPCPEVTSLIGAEARDRIASSSHMPSHVVWHMACLLRTACDEDKLNRFSFLQIDKERATLIDHIGACERILKTPLPLAYAIKTRRVITLFLATLPFALLHRVNSVWVIPIITMMVAYPLVSLDQIGIELQNPFAKSNLNHLPLGDISATIERNILGMLGNPTAAAEIDRYRTKPRAISEMEQAS